MKQVYRGGTDLLATFVTSAAAEPAVAHSGLVGVRRRWLGPSAAAVTAAGGRRRRSFDAVSRGHGRPPRL